MSYLAPQQNVTVPGLHLVYSWEAIDRSSYPRRTSPFFETELPSLVLCETIILNGFPTNIGCVLLFCSSSQRNLWSSLKSLKPVVTCFECFVSSFQSRSIFFFIFVVSQRMLPFRHHKLNSAIRGLEAKEYSSLFRAFSPTICILSLAPLTLPTTLFCLSPAISDKMGCLALFNLIIIINKNTFVKR